MIITFKCDTTMSADKEIATMLSYPGKTPTEKVLLNLNLAKKEVLKVLKATGSSVFDLCTNIEGARTREGLKAAFSQFNMMMRVFLETAPTAEHIKLVLDTFCSIRLSERLRASLESTSSVPEALSIKQVWLLTWLISYAPRRR